MKNPWIVIGVIVVLLIGGSVWYGSTSAERYNEGVEVRSHVKGNPEGEVVLIKYSDFQCPACAAFLPAIDDVLSEFGDSVRFEYRHFPLMQIHPFAEPAARAAEAAGQQGKFYEYHDALFANQAAWGNSVNPSQFFLRFAEELELDMQEFTRHQRSTVLRDKVRSEFEEARAAGFTGTPTFTLNGERMNISTYQDFRDQVAAAVNGTDVQVNFGSSDAAPPTRVQAVPLEAGDDTEAEPEVEFGI